MAKTTTDIRQLGARDTVRLNIFELGPVHHDMGDFEVTPTFLDQMQRSFAALCSAGYRPPILIEHNQDGRCYGIVKKLVRNARGGLDAICELADGFKSMMRRGMFRNVSPSFVEAFQHPHTGEELPNVLRELSLVSIPHLKNLKPPAAHYTLSEGFAVTRKAPTERTRKMSKNTGRARRSRVRNLDEYDSWFKRENNRGNGYAVGDDGDDINKIRGVGRLIRPSRSTSQVAVYDAGKTLVLVGDANGPWAVKMPKDLGDRTSSRRLAEEVEEFDLASFVDEMRQGMQTLADRLDELEAPPVEMMDEDEEDEEQALADEEDEFTLMDEEDEEDSELALMDEEDEEDPELALMDEDEEDEDPKQMGGRRLRARVVSLERRLAQQRSENAIRALMPTSDERTISDLVTLHLTSPKAAVRMARRLSDSRGRERLGRQGVGGGAATRPTMAYALAEARKQGLAPGPETIAFLDERYPHLMED